MHENKSEAGPEQGGGFGPELKKILSEDTDTDNLAFSSEGADLAVPPSREEIVRSMIARIEKMTGTYTLGLTTSQTEIFEHLRFLNDNFFFDRPVTDSELTGPEKNPLKASMKKTLFPVLRNALGLIFERQRSFNGELVKLLNRLLEVAGNQRDFNMDLIKFCERTIDHYRLMEGLERRFDDYFAYLTRLSVLEEDMIILQKRVSELESKTPVTQPKGKKRRK
ncbi:hypothetical protein JXQ70_18565 [bacterium]|nr:hypothetical protein [bacterium]